MIDTAWAVASLLQFGLATSRIEAATSDPTHNQKSGPRRASHWDVEFDETLALPAHKRAHAPLKTSMVNSQVISKLTYDFEGF